MGIKSSQLRHTSIYILLCFTILLLSCNCSTRQSKSPNPSTEVGDTNNLPPLWPWRGIAITSAHAGSDHINFKHLKSVHANHVSLAYMPGAHARNYKLDLQKTIKDDIQWLHQMLDSCEKYEMTAMITYQEFPHDVNAGFNQSTSRFWQDPQMLDSAMNTIIRIVKEFQDRGPELSAFEFFCEPVMKDMRSVRPPTWRSFAQRIINEVRKIDKKRYLVMNTGPWGHPWGYKDWQPLNGDRLIYGTHMYQPHVYTSSPDPKKSEHMKYPGMMNYSQWNKDKIRSTFEPVRKFQQEHGVLIYVGEFSVTPWSNGYELFLDDCIGVFEEFGFSYNYWNLNGWPMWNVHYEPGYPEQPKGVADVGYKSSKWKVLRKYFSKNNIK